MTYSNPPIPKLPGYTVSLPQSLGDKRLAKNQTLGYINGYQREDALREVRDLPPRDATATASPTQQLSPEATGTFSPSKSGTFADSPSKLPQWVENDRKVLRFFGYFKEGVVESNIENHRVRKIILFYYLEDGSMHVAEPKQDNSGIPQARRSNSIAGYSHSKCLPAGSVRKSLHMAFVPGSMYTHRMNSKLNCM